VDRFKAAPEDAARDAFERALVRHAVKLTREPSAVNAADIAALREAGLDDRAILDLTLVVAYFNFVNRIADGLGVPLEESP
jgi:uncharacterized peroxidase-related enzyme